MNRRQFISSTAVATVGCAFGAPESGRPLRLHPENPHYFQWQGRPTVLVTAGEHYGAVLNLDFDFAPYFKELRGHQFNLTRIFSGAYREVPGSFNITGNTLAPLPGKFVCPWARRGEKFDLAHWDESYFRRLKDFITRAGENGVMVELVLFCTMYDDKVWEASPMNARNNVNGIGKVDKYAVYSGKEQGLLDVQREMARKLASELNDFDNLYYEVCNEPYERGGLTKEWNDAIISALVETEASLSKKHLIAQGFPHSTQAVKDLNRHVSVMNFHAAKPETVQLNYHRNRAMGFDETGGSDRSDRKYRTEGWEWIMAGGAVYDHLDFSFTTERPDGTAVPLPSGTPGGGGPELRRQLAVLKRFMEGFDFLRMRPADDVVKEKRMGGSEKAAVRVLAEAGKTYAIYVKDGTNAELGLDLPKGAYKAEWVNTRTGAVAKAESMEHGGGVRNVSSPRYSEDVALRLRRTG